MVGKARMEVGKVGWHVMVCSAEGGLVFTGRGWGFGG